MLNLYILVIEEQIPFDPEYLKDEAMRCLNAVPQPAGICASQAMIAHTPRDPLGVHKLTTTQASDPRELYVQKMRVRIVTCSAICKAIIGERINKVGNLRERVGARDDSSATKYCNGDLVECW